MLLCYSNSAAFSDFAFLRNSFASCSARRKMFSHFTVLCFMQRFVIFVTLGATGPQTRLWLHFCTL